MTICGIQVILRPIRMSEARLVTRWFSDPAVAPFIKLGNSTIAEVRSVIRERQKKKLQHFFIIEKKDRVPIGTIELAIFDKANCGMLGTFVIGERRFRGCGLGRDALSALVRQAFGCLGLHRVQLSVRANNPRAVRIYKKFGFRVEGRLRDAVLWHGRYGDLIQMGLLNREWKKK